MMHFILIGLLACGMMGESASTDPEAIAALATTISSAPDDADATLSAAGHTRASFDAALYEIAMDPALTKRYLAAR